MAVPIINPPASSEPKSQHLADSTLQPFLQDDFDPVDYLNRTLPPLAVPSTTRGTQQSSQHARPLPLSELNSQLQTLLSQLNAQANRLSDVLTQLSDEIIRSGSRLAYEVEVLGADAATLQESLNHNLKSDIDLFTQKERVGSSVEKEVDQGEESRVDSSKPPAPTKHSYLERLKTLNLVRSRLDAVIKVFGEAMAWPLAPSELSIGGSFISVSAPDTGGDSRAREEKGKEYLDKLKGDIDDLLNGANDTSTLEPALRRIQELKNLAEIWKGTAEEKARLRLIENLQKPVEEKQRLAERSNINRRQAPSPARSMDYRYGGLI